jgi:hypothetical protein
LTNLTHSALGRAWQLRHQSALIRENHTSDILR